jgi:hypothetical protein
MATIGTGKNGETAIVGLAKNKTVVVSGDSAETESLRNIRMDFSTGGIQTISTEHAQVHSGDHYFLTDSNTIAAGTSDVIDYLIVVPNTTTWPHMTVDADGTLITSFAMYENCVAFATSDGYTQLTPYNNNRNSSNTATTQIWKKVGSSDASSDFGTLIYTYSSGTTSVLSNAPSQPRESKEMILMQGVKYIYRIISGSAANLVNAIFSWYEHTNES